MIETLPKIGDPVVIRDHNAATYLSRVEDITPSEVTLARPFDLPAADPFGPGTELKVTWLSSRGTAVLPVRLVETTTQSRVQLWVVAVLGDMWFEQRRDYVRVPAPAPMTLLVPEDGAAATVLTARLIDVSEAALRCSIDDDEPLAHRCGDRAAVVSQFEFRDTEFEIPGRIQAAEQRGETEGRTQLIVLFDQPVRQADPLRRRIFAQEIHNAARSRPTDSTSRRGR